MGFWSRVKKRMKIRNPWVSGALNFFGWGLGYLYAGRKKLVGLSLFTLIMLWTSMIAARVILPFVIYGSLLFVCFALARDAFIETKKRNREVESNE